MRVTNSMVTRGLTARLLENQRLLAEAQERVATGKKVRKMSDDPTAGSAIMQASGQLRALEQYRRNVQSVGARIDAEETALDQVTQLMIRAKELGVGQIGATANADSRRAAAVEVRQLLAQAVQLGNQRFGEEYLFGGTNAQDRLPFDGAQTATAPRFAPLVAGVATPPTGTRQIEVGAGQYLTGPHDGSAVFLDTGVFDVLQDLGDALAADDPARIGAAMRDLEGSFAGVQALVGEAGARQNQVELLETQLDAVEQNLESFRSDLAEVDMERAITEMVARQTAYQAAMLASSRVMGLSLTEYLR
ncbi:flagellin [Roseisolibacter sp. H3M3-2]|uniref:flagellin N-terminal helical domain-containing protein n=1 Tax=Roseisolibacter sp. H3M3-2 TaxID=3031323 RepID=UPI0023DB7CE2|nr:flagellin [Roseisolibacter sp. H3M3-2]MDF1503727.1 flagellin [Roseisolibacter sp. H3M3-2]